jgi:hypothetical protein
VTGQFTEPSTHGRRIGGLAGNGRRMSAHQAELAASIEIGPEQILRIALTGDGYFNYEVASGEARVTRVTDAGVFVDQFAGGGWHHYFHPWSAIWLVELRDG